MSEQRVAMCGDEMCDQIFAKIESDHDKLEARIIALREALEFYSRPIDYNVHATGGYGLQKNPDRLSRIDADEGAVARMALTKDSE